ncbi:hypothetical protein ACKWTF_004714 [Chironomus riparius]
MDIKCIFMIVFILALISRMKVNNRLDRYTLKLNEKFRGINNQELYEFVMRNPHIVNKWMDSISYFMESNEMPLGVGKVYEVFVGTYSIYFVATRFEERKSITIQTDSYFLILSSFSISFHENCNCSTLQIEHNFNIDSMLFQNLFGDAMRKFLEERLQRALTNLKLMLYNLQSDGLHVY